MEEVEELIEKRIWVTYDFLYNKLPHDKVFKSEHGITEKWVEKYSILIEPDKNYTINSFD